MNEDITRLSSDLKMVFSNIFYSLLYYYSIIKNHWKDNRKEKKTEIRKYIPKQWNKINRLKSHL